MRRLGHGLDAERLLAQRVHAEIIVGRAGGQYQLVVFYGLVAGGHLPGPDVYVLDMAHVIAHVAVSLELAPEREADVGAGQSRRRYLIEQRRKTVEIIPVHQAYLVLGGIQLLAQSQSREPASDYHDPLHNLCYFLPLKRKSMLLCFAICSGRRKQKKV